MNTKLSQYSSLFSCIYNEQEPIGHLGRGTHYSVFRCVEWLDVTRSPINKPQVHDFSVIWDEDHDTRVIEVIENIYMSGLLSPIQFIGERKGTLTVIVASKFYFGGTPLIGDYKQQLQTICNESSHGDHWPVEIGMFDRSPNYLPTNPHQTDVCAIIHAEDHKVVSYLRNIDSLWELGTKTFKPKANVSNISIAQPIPAPPSPT
ncbi:hypothetical protein [Shewanella oncorhynchi]|uniref:hypothetical protein n=1 Tax=Shewanella oncorhynchi TaxID=2726434 RepID=UPI003D7B95D5